MMTDDFVLQTSLIAFKRLECLGMILAQWCMEKVREMWQGISLDDGTLRRY